MLRVHGLGCSTNDAIVSNFAFSERGCECSSSSTQNFAARKNYFNYLLVRVIEQSVLSTITFVLLTFSFITNKPLLRFEYLCKPVSLVLTRNCMSSSSFM